MSANLNFFDQKKNRLVRVGEFNVTNDNASLILAAIGLNPDYDHFAGTEIIEFETSLCQYLDSDIAQFVDCGRDSVNHGNVMDCGRREGYLTEKVTLALDYTRKARMRGATHAYFS